MNTTTKLPARERHPVLFGFLLALGIIFVAGLLPFIFRPNPSFRSKISLRNASSDPILLASIGKASPNSEMSFHSAKRNEHGVVLKPGESVVVAISTAHSVELARGSLVVLCVLDPERLTAVSSIVIDVGAAFTAGSTVDLPYAFDGREFTQDRSKER